MSARKTFHVKAPCRVDLSGGTLDLWPIYLFFPKGLKLNHMALELYAHAQITFEASEKFEVVVDSLDLKVRRKHSSLASLEKSVQKDIKANPLRWVERVVSHFMNQWGLNKGSWTITTWSEVPPGSGLGGSSTLGVAIGAALARAAGREKDISDAPWIYQQTMRNLEGIEIEHPAGDQDYVPAIFGGLLTFSLGVDRREILKHEGAAAEDVASRMALIYTGKPHHSGINNWQVYKDFISKKPSVRKALTEIHAISEKMSADLAAKKASAWISGIGKEWLSRQKLGSSVNAPILKQAERWAKTLGASSVKACGAGGGGCLLVVFPNSKKRDAAIKIKPTSKQWVWMKVSCAQEGILDVLK